LQQFVSSLGSSPAFITLSCSGLPDQTACSFTPNSLEIAPGQNEGITSSMVLQTQAAGTAMATPPAHRGNSPIAWAFLLPGALGLGGLAWGSRHRPWLNRLALLALVGLVTSLGTTACNPQYDYYHHGPPTNLPTPAGTYTITVTGQSQNGITAISNSTTLTLTVK
jgi:hypothetical protein